MKRVLTYGTFDLFHYGHMRLLQRARDMGDFLVVGLSTDEFNAGKGKTSAHDYETRMRNLMTLRCVDLVIPESCWEQKLDDVLQYEIDVVVMGHDWAGSNRFEFLREHCELKFLPRTEGVSTTELKKVVGL